MAEVLEVSFAWEEFAELFPQQMDFIYRSQAHSDCLNNYGSLINEHINAIIPRNDSQLSLRKDIAIF